MPIGRGGGVGERLKEKMVNRERCVNGISLVVLGLISLVIYDSHVQHSTN